MEVLRQGGTILYPTDTVWGIGCDATNEQAVNKVFAVKQRVGGKSLIVLVDSIETLKNYVEDIPEMAFDLMESITDPLTIIYPGARNLAPNVPARDGSVGIRIPNDPLCQQLVRALGKPLTSTSANLSGSPNPVSFSKISPEIRRAVDFIVPDYQARVRMARPSTIIRIGKDGTMEIIRN